MHEDVCYQRNYLIEVVARIDFVTPLTQFERSLPAKLSNKFSQSFPIVEPIDIVGIEFQLGADVPKTDPLKLKEWQFYGVNREKRIGVSSQAVYLLYSSYTTYEAMKSEFSEVVLAIRDHIPDVRAKRFGLRYVNKVVPDDGGTSMSELSSLLSHELFCTHGFFHNPELLTRVFHVVELKYGNMDLRYQFGFPNPDYPAVIRRPEFVIDLDSYVQTSHDLEDSLRYMDTAHSHIQTLFEESITDKLRERMGR